ncbi:MAG: hypothetical protein Q6K12_02410 [Gloeomargarita sp. DG_1_6_bins_138]
MAVMEGEKKIMGLSEREGKFVCLGSQRWPIYHRLQELEIPCRCEPHRPLEIEMTHPRDVLLVWSVVHQVMGTRAQHVAWLERCWQGD